MNNVDKNCRSFFLTDGTNFVSINALKAFTTRSCYSDSKNYTVSVNFK